MLIYNFRIEISIRIDITGWSSTDYSPMILLGYDNRRPTSAARTEAHPMLYCQPPNKPGWVRGLPASAAPAPSLDAD